MAYIIDKDNYFKNTQLAKSEELINIVEVASNPIIIHDLADLFDDEFYKTSEPFPIAAGETIVTEIKFKSVPVKGPVAQGYFVAETTTEPPYEELEYSEEHGNISSEELTTTAVYYAWGATVTVTNNYGQDGYCIIVVSGYPLKAEPEIVTAQDDESIAENGVLKYKYPDNHLIQSRAISENIADTLVVSYATPRKDINLSWRGNPALELLDEIQAPIYQKKGINTQGFFYIFRQTLEFDGALRSVLDGRKVSITTTTTLAP